MVFVADFTHYSEIVNWFLSTKNISETTQSDAPILEYLAFIPDEVMNKYTEVQFGIHPLVIRFV